MAKRPTFNDVSNRDANASEINDALTQVVEGFDNTLSRDGSTPNNMESDLDMDSNDILNAWDVDVLNNLTVQGVDILEAIANDVTGGEIYNTVNRFQGDGTTTVFTLTTTPTGPSNVFAYVSGVHQQHNEWSVVDNTIVFSEAPAYSETPNIEVIIQEDLESAALGTDGPAISPKLFGAVGDGVTDDTAAVRSCITYANTNNIPVSFYGMSSVLIDANAEIIVNTDVDGVGCTLVARNGLQTTPDSGTVLTMFKAEDTDTPVVTGQVATPAADGTKVADLSEGSMRAVADFCKHTAWAYIEGASGSGPQIPQRYLVGLTDYEQSFAVQVNGRTAQPLSLDLTTETLLNFKYRLMPSRGRITFKGFTVDTTSFNNQEIIRIERNDVTVSDMQFTQADGDADPDTINRLIKVYQCAYVDIERITSHAQQDGGDGGGTYVFNLQEAAEIHVRRVNAIEGWGCMGSNDCNGVYISDCNINRMDVHSGGHNYFLSNTTVYNRGTVLGWGGGDWKISNCKFIDAPGLQMRADYGGFFFGNITFENCSFMETGFTATIIDMVTNPVGSNLISYPVAKAINIINCVRSDADGNGSNRRFLPINLVVNTTSGFLAPIAPSNINISGLACGGNWRFGAEIDYQNMVLPSNVDFCSLTINNVKATRLNTTDYGIYTPVNVIAGAGDYKVDVRCEGVTKLSINTSEHAKADHYLSDCDVARVEVAVGSVVEIDGGLLTDPHYFGAETHVPVGNTKSGTGYTTVRNTKVEGTDASNGWDLSDVVAMSGVDIDDIAANDGTLFPTNCDRRQAFFGWRKDVTEGDFTADITDAQGTPNVSSTSANGFYRIHQGIARVTYTNTSNISSAGLTSTDVVRFDLPTGITASATGSEQQYVAIPTQQLPLPGQYFARTVAGANYIELCKMTTGNVADLLWSELAANNVDIFGFTIDVLL